MVDWSLLPKDLLEAISGCFETCLEIVHLRSVCSRWRLAVPPSYSGRVGLNTILNIFNDNPRFDGDNKHCILKKIPIFLLRFQTPFDVDYLFAGMSQSESGNQELLLPLPGHCMKYKYGILLNTLSSQIISLGHFYKISFKAITTYRRTRRQDYSKKVAFLQLDSRDFAVLAGVFGDLMMYRSCDKKWTQIEGGFQTYLEMVSFKGKFYVVDTSGRGQVLVIEPSSLEVHEIPPVTRSHESFDERLIVSGHELLLVQRMTPGSYGQEHKYTWFRLFRLEDDGQRRWVRTIDIEDRVVFLGYNWNLCYSTKELPGMKGNCIVFISEGTLVFDLGTRKTSQELTECRGYMSAFGKNRESLVSCGIVTSPIPAVSIYDSSISFIWY